jgi:hypothetical protein
MGFQIEDGKGSGRHAAVNSEFQLVGFSVSETTDRHINYTNQGVWSLPFEGIDPVGADDYFVYFKNTGTKLYAVTDIRVESSVAGTVEVHGVSGTPSYTASLDITPVNRYLGSSKQPAATVKTDTDVTGLTSDGTLFYINCSTANELFHLRTTSNIFVPPGQSFALLWDQGTGVLKGLVSIVEVEIL